MPASELEVFRIAALALGCVASEGRTQLVADVVERNAVQCVVVRQLNTNAYDEVQLLVAFVVARAVGDVCLSSREPSGVLVAGAVHAPAWVVGFRCLGQMQVSVFVPDAAEQLVRLAQVGAQPSAQLVSVQPLAKPYVNAHLDFVLELVGVPPHAVGEVQTVLAPCLERRLRLRIVCVVRPALLGGKLRDVHPEVFVHQCVVLVVPELPSEVYTVEDYRLHPVPHIAQEAVDALLGHRVVVK